MRTLTPFTAESFTAEILRRGLIRLSDEDEVCFVCKESGDADGYCPCFESAIVAGGDTGIPGGLPDPVEEDEEEEKPNESK